MTSSPLDFCILDTGPCLNFFGTGHGDILLAVLTHLCKVALIPDAVEREVMHKSAEIPAYTPAHLHLCKAVGARVLNIITVEVGVDKQLEAVVEGLMGMPAEEIPPRQKDYGETMAVAHGYVLQQRGASVRLVVNDRDGRDLARTHQLETITTMTVLRKAALLGVIPDHATMTAVYSDMQPHDRGLKPMTEASVQEYLFGKSVVYGSQAASRRTEWTGTPPPY